MPDEVTPVVETNDNPPPIEAPDYKYEEINQKEMGEIAREEPPKEEPKVETNPDEVEIEFDPAKFKEDTIRETREAILAEQKAEEDAKKVEESKEPTEKEKQYIAWEEKFNSDNSRPPTYLEAMQFVEERAVEAVEERQRESIRQYTEEQEKVKKAQEDENALLNKWVDDGYAELYKAGVLTPVKDPNNPSDQGVVERKSLAATWKTVNDARRVNGQPEIIDPTRIANYYWKKPNAQPAGADAPIQGSRSATTPPDSEQTYTNADLKRPWSFFKRGS